MPPDPRQCCERDHDFDGNCDVHPPGEALGDRVDRLRLDRKLGAAAARNHQLTTTRGGLVDRLRVAAADVEFPRQRLGINDGEQFERTAVQTRQELLVPLRFRETKFSTFEPATDSQRATWNLARRWTSEAYEGGGGLLAIVGTQGCGKSHLLYSAINSLLFAREYRPVYARPWYMLADELRYGGPSIFAPHLHDEAQEVRTRLYSQRIVAIDEIRPTASTDFDQTELSKFACWAYDNRLAVMVTTNINPLENILGLAGASRFTQAVMTGPDLRHVPKPSPGAP